MHSDGRVTPLLIFVGLAGLLIGHSLPRPGIQRNLNHAVISQVDHHSGFAKHTKEKDLAHYNSSLGLELVLARNCRIDSLWMNMGYEEEGIPLRSMVERSQLLVEKFATFAALSAADELIVDLGSGFGDQDLLFLRKFSVQRIISINFSELQNAIANKRAQLAGLDHRFVSKLGDARSMQMISDSSVDKVIAIEAVMHWTRTPEDNDIFLSEVYRVLKPGGHLVMTDFYWEDGIDFRTKKVNRFYDAGEGRTLLEYKAAIRRAGFDDVIMQSVPKYRSTFRHQSSGGSSDIASLAKSFTLSESWRVAAESDIGESFHNVVFDGMQYVMVDVKKPQ